MPRATRAPHELYSPERPTAVVLSGTGADGAYHAGVLRALHDAGVKVDLAAGRGIGVLGATLFAADGASLLWDETGLWRKAAVGRTYRFRWPYRVVVLALAACASVLASPLVLLVAAVMVWPVAFGLGLLGVSTGSALAGWFVDVVRWGFAPTQLPTWLPRAVVAILAMLMAILGSRAAWDAYRAPRHGAGPVWWRLLGPPIESTRFSALVVQMVRDLVGAGAPRAAAERELGQRFAELMAAGTGQPGHRDLLVAVHDVDARRDLVFGRLRGSAASRQFPDATGPAPRRAEAFDLVRDGSLLVDVLRGAATLPAVSEPVWLRFPADSVWRGEVHRVTDRPAGVGRLLEEAAAAGIEQVIVVSARPAAHGPNALAPAALDGRGRANDWMAAEETAALRDGIRFGEKFFHAVFVVRPLHNPVGPLDVDGVHDPRSDRRISLADLVAQGYEDAFRQFIEPALGAAGERVVERTVTP